MGHLSADTREQLPETLTSLRWRAWLASALTMAVAALAVVDFGLVAQFRGLVNDARAGSVSGRELRARARDLEDLGNSVYIATIAVVLTAAVAWMVWLWAARRNAGRLSAGPFKRSQGWAVGAWLIPFANLWLPKQVVDDTWSATARYLGAPDLPSRKSTLVYFWWAAFVVYAILDRVVGRMDGDTLDEVLRLATWEQVYDVCGVVAAALGVAVIWRITRLQQAAATRVSELRSASPV